MVTMRLRERQRDGRAIGCCEILAVSAVSGGILSLERPRVTPSGSNGRSGAPVRGRRYACPRLLFLEASGLKAGASAFSRNVKTKGTQRLCTGGGDFWGEDGEG